ncbi:uncharacterized protein LOC143026191 isoform X2 [Oratosquilla oratoria]
MITAQVRTLVLLATVAAAMLTDVDGLRHTGGGRPLAVIRRGQDGKSYAFGYHVDATPEEDTLFDQFEERLGDKTRGQWRVALPDNRLQVVTYRADEGGFHADISYDYVADLEAAKAIMASDETPWTSHFGVLFADNDHHHRKEGSGGGSHGAHGHGHHRGDGPGQHQHRVGGGGGSGRPAAVASPLQLLAGQDSDPFNFIPDGTPFMIFHGRKPPSESPPKTRGPTPRPGPRPSKTNPRAPPRPPATRPRPSTAGRGPPPSAPASRPRPTTSLPRRPPPRAPATTPRPSTSVATRVPEGSDRRPRPGTGSRPSRPSFTGTSSNPDDEEDVEVVPALFVDLTALTDTPFEHEDILHRLLSALDLSAGGHAPHPSNSDGEDGLSKKDYTIPNKESVLRRLEAIVHGYPIHLIHT